MNKRSAWKLFMNTGLPEAYTVYSASKGEKKAAPDGGENHRVNECDNTSQHGGLS